PTPTPFPYTTLFRSMALSLTTDPPLKVEPERTVVVELGAGERITAALSVADAEMLIHVPAERALALLRETEIWWRNWARSIDVADRKSTRLNSSHRT